SAQAEEGRPSRRCADRCRHSRPEKRQCAVRSGLRPRRTAGPTEGRMRRHRRAATAALLALGCLALAWALVLGRAPAGPPADTAQGTRLETPGPPDEAPPPGPPGLPPAPPPTAAGPVDPPAPLVTIRVRVPAQGSPGQELV